MNKCNQQKCIFIFGILSSTHSKSLKYTQICTHIIINHVTNFFSKEIITLACSAFLERPKRSDPCLFTKKLYFTSILFYDSEGNTM